MKATAVKLRLQGGETRRFRVSDSSFPSFLSCVSEVLDTNDPLHTHTFHYTDDENDSCILSTAAEWTEALSLLTTPTLTLDVSAVSVHASAVTSPTTPADDVGGLVVGGARHPLAVLGHGGVHGLHHASVGVGGRWPRMSASEVAALPVVVREVEEDEWEVVEEVESVPEVPESIRDAFTEELVFYVNGVRYAPEPASIDPTMKLVEFLQQVGLTGTKLGCGEGGCGACTVVLSRPDAATGTATHLAVNSCLRPVYTLDGAMITTTEGLGSERRGLHPIQKRIAEYNGSQCGFCTPGHVMSMYGLLSNEPSPTPQQVEDRFDGNLCRCTGYRPILRAMQTFASDGSEPRVRVSDGADDDDAAPCGHAMLVGPRECAPGTCCDVEDICADDAAVPPELPAELLERAKSPRPLMVRSRSSGRLWFRPTSLSSVYDLLKTYASSSVVRLCVGNTSIGVAKYYVPNKADDPSVFIDIGQLSDLTGATVTSSSLVVGAAVTLTQLHDELVSHASSGGVYFDALAKHLMHVANWDVRNVGSWAGNLMLHKQHKNFPSDLVTILTAAGALVVVSSSAGSRTLSVPDLMAATLEPDELLFSLAIPFAAATSAKVDPGAAGAKKTFFETFKVSDRAQNAHALVNAGFNVVVSLDGDATPTVDEAYLCFGGVRTGLLVASDAANALKGQPVSSATLSSVLSVLEKECEPPADPSPRTWVLTPAAYRQSLACTLFYKFFLSMMADLEPSSVPSSLKSAYAPAVRPVSSGTDFITMTKWDDYPVHAPFPKLSAPAQASGEAQYVGDMMPAGNVLEAAFVQSTAPKATITSLDVSQALKAPGVVDVITAADIAKIGGSNNCGQFPGDEEILASSKVIYVGQPLAVVVADTYEHAHAASKLVAVTYEADKDHPPVFTIKEAVTADSYLTNNQYVSNPMPTLKRGDVTTGFKDSAKVVSGAVSLGMQYHMYMETQRAMVVPEEMNGLRVYAATQAPSMTRDYVSQATGLPDNQIQVEVKRVGGAYGGKISRSQVISSAAAVAARYLNKPVRLVLDRQHDMNFQGRRNGFEADYKIGFDEDGKVQAVQSAFLMNGGATYDSTLGSCYTVQLMLDNAYFYPNVQTSIAAVRTSLCSNTSMRAPGMLQGTTFAEVIMDRIAWELQMEPNDVREANMYKDGETTPFGQKITTFDARMPVVWKTLLEMADYDTRRAAVDAFNKANRWVKRGIRCMPLKYMIVNDKYQYRNTAIVALHTDGTVIVTTSGCEAGQGLNTKVAQTVAFELGVPLSAVNVAKTSTEKITLSTPTGGSGTSETCCEAAILACKTLNDTLAPYKKAHPDFSFGQLVSAAFYDGQAIEAIGNCALPTNPDGVVEYWVYAGACSEVSVDVLTGKVELLRTDIVYDGGESLNAMVDIGQVEGAFVQGLGFCFSEEVVLDGSTGRMINNGTWDYKPPSSKDIPINFNVRMLGLASDAPNSILSSKASGEPPYQLAVSALLAAKEAIYAARKDAGNTDYFDFDTPATVDKIQAACLVSVDQLTL